MILYVAKKSTNISRYTENLAVSTGVFDILTKQSKGYLVGI